MGYQELSEEVFIDIGEGGSKLVVDGQPQEFTRQNGKINEVIITIGDIEYEFKLKTGENFYFVISQEIGGEKHVVTSPEEEGKTKGKKDKD